MALRTWILGTVVTATVLLMPARGEASAISLSDLLGCGSVSTCALTGATVTTSGGTLSSQTLNGFTGVGVSGGSVNGEIDGSESISIAFTQASVFDSLRLVFLYEPPAFNDVEIPPGSDETARLVATLLGGGSASVTVNVTGATTATTSGGSISNVSSAADTGGGVWLLTSPFGSTPITNLTFVSGDPGPNATYSDFAIGDMAYTPSQTQPVPEPGTLLLFGSGVAWFTARRRRRA